MSRGKVGREIAWDDEATRALISIWHENSIEHQLKDPKEMLVVSSSAAKGAFDETACVICNSAGKTLTGTNGGLVKIRIAVEQLQDSLAASRINAYSNTFMYHLKPKCCYSTCILNSEVEKICPKKSEPELVEEVEEGESSDSYNVAKRRKKSSSSSYKDIERKCVICDRVRENCGDRGRVLYRTSESDRAASFLDALNFYKDEVETRCAFLANTVAASFKIETIKYKFAV